MKIDPKSQLLALFHPFISRQFMNFQLVVLTLTLSFLQTMK